MSSGGILVGFNTRDTIIEDNVVAPGPGLPADADFALPFGIQAGPSAGGTYVIRHNRVRCENPQADGIVLFGTEDPTFAPLVPITGAVVAQNDVYMHGSLLGGISLYGSVTRSRITGNRISGDGAIALYASTSGVLDTDLVDSNVFHGNDLSRFSATDADVFFDINTLDNLFFGPTGTLVDLGTGNRFK
jgi:hypothetical protein